MVRRIIPLSPKDVYVLIPRKWEYVTLHVQRSFADVIRVKVLKIKDYFVLFGRGLAILRSSDYGRIVKEM